MNAADRTKPAAADLLRAQYALLESMNDLDGLLSGRRVSLARLHAAAVAVSVDAGRLYGATFVLNYLRTGRSLPDAGRLMRSKAFRDRERRAVEHAHDEEADSKEHQERRRQRRSRKAPRCEA